MLQWLKIRNIAVVDELEISFSPRFTVFTGETGAGKSLIIQAVSLLAGEKSSSSLLRAGCEHGSVTGIFTIDRQCGIEQLLDSFGIEYDESELIIKRELTREGKTRCYINNQPVSVTVLKTLGDQFIDIHGQHDHQSLFHQSEYLNLIDRYAGIKNEIVTYRTFFSEVSQLHDEIQSLRVLQSRAQERMDLLSFQIQELAAAQLQENEEESLQAEYRKLSHNQELVQHMSYLYSSLIEEEHAALDTLSSCLVHLDAAKDIDPSLEALHQESIPLVENLRDFATQVRVYRETVENNYDPGRLQIVLERLDCIETLKKKYKMSFQDLRQQCPCLQEEYNRISLTDEQLTALEASVHEKEEKLYDKARELSALRKKAAHELQARITKNMGRLGMTKTQCAISFNEIEPNETGIDSIDFLVALNPGEGFHSLRQTASGGEISRIMLAIKEAVASVSHVPTMIFDEIDVNLGGEAAGAVAEMMGHIALMRQIVCITHLARIAAQADCHLTVQKKVQKNRTFTQIAEVTGPERIHEIARMLSGEHITPAVIQHAEELLRLQPLITS